MTDLIDRAAKAAHDADPWLYGQTGTGEDIYKPWEEAPPAVQQHYRAQAVAVMEADPIREFIKRAEARGRSWVIASRERGGYFALMNTEGDEGLSIFGREFRENAGFGETAEDACAEWVARDDRGEYWN